ncbi:hypothetical protein [Flavobacterium aquicola]|uniref:Uncharacterized protein n=1 Tax=Flavobacterium aquicola TaxID=1682742 RepID=A0A3E0DWC1_9FLAO|nr:hypothetical protein [Flavobacterium aquicola]REG90255.1 hypothetical protein C8P67_1265 [Flavobacterium aquicola]
MKLTKRKEASEKGNRISWLDPVKKKKSLVEARERYYQARRDLGLNSFTNSHRETLRIKKYKQYYNFIAIYLIKNKIDSKELMRYTRRLNIPNLYINDLKFKEAIERFVSETNKAREGVITFDIAFELITKSLTIKKELFPHQIAPIRARENRKARDKEDRQKRDTKGNN